EQRVRPPRRPSDRHHPRGGHVPLAATAHRRDHPRRVAPGYGGLDDLLQPLPVCHLLSLRSSGDIERFSMIGAQALVASLTGAGVDVCFMNPGTSEMHFVGALDSVPEM